MLTEKQITLIRLDSLRRSVLADSGSVRSSVKVNADGRYVVEFEAVDNPKPALKDLAATIRELEEAARAGLA